MVSKTSQHHLVIEAYDKLNNKNISERDISNYLSSQDNILFYSFIKHDKDINDLGELERVHYHLVIKYNNTYSKNTVINDIAKSLMVNRNIISNRIGLDFILSVQYLIHQNNKEKYQYDILDIWTNDVNEMFSILYDSVSSYDLDIDYLLELVRDNQSISAIYKILGLKKVKQYRAIINDLWKEKINKL